MTVESGVLDARVDRAREVMEEQGVDLLLVAPSSDLVYLAGYRAHASERPTLLALTSHGPSILLVPALEAPRASNLALDLVPYAETDDPFRILEDALDGSSSITTVAISDEAWASVVLRLQSAFSRAAFRPASTLLRELRMRKDRREIDLLAEAGTRTDAVFLELLQIQFAGKTERDIADEISKRLETRGLKVWDMGAIVASGPNSASPHHMTGDRRLEEGDAVVLDFGGSLEGYYSDTTRTVHVGPPSDRFSRVYETVRQAEEAGVEAVRPGRRAEEVDRAARGVITSAGYGEYFIHRTGHGLGLDIHEEPYMLEGNQLLLESGMVFSVEPGIYLPYEFGVRIEDIVAVTEQGARRLNHATLDLQIVR